MSLSNAFSGGVKSVSEFINMVNINMLELTLSDP